MISWFEKVMGSENFSDELVDKLVYGTDASQIKGEASLVAWPTNAEEVRKIMLFAKRNEFGLVVRGGGSNLVGGCVSKGTIVLDLTKMNKVLEARGDHIVVEPGVVVGDLNKRLKNMFFPIIPLNSEISTIGGMIGMNAISVMGMRYGRMEDWVDEIEVIDGTAKLRKLEDKEAKAFIGAEGTSGIVVRAKLRLAPVIKDKSADLLKFDDLEGLMEKIVALKKNKNVLGLEFVNEVAAGYCKLENKDYLIVLYEGLEGEIKERREIDNLISMVKNVTPILSAGGYVVGEDPQLPLVNIIEFLYWLREKGIPASGHIGLGMIHSNFKRNSELIGEMRKLVIKLKGKLCSEYGIGLLRKDCVGKEFVDKIKKLRNSYDSKILLNREKIC